MINTINLQNLSQENVSCLNTTLVLLMLANRRRKLPQYLKAIQHKSIQQHQLNDIIASPHVITSQQQPQTSSVNKDTLTNFKDLLLFWQEHYLNKDKDCVNLEKNSRIEFDYWKNTVDLLLDMNIKNKCSLNYYLDYQSNYFENKVNRIDEYRCD